MCCACAPFPYGTTWIICHVDVYLSHNGEVIPNHGYVLIRDIGYTDDTALLCHTNRPPPPGGPNHSSGEWYAPDGTGVTDTAVPGFRRDRGPMVVRLKKRTGTGTPPQGIYQCSIQDAGSSPQTLYVGLYNIGGGNIICKFFDRLALPLFVSNTLRASHTVW